MQSLAARSPLTSVNSSRNAGELHFAIGKRHRIERIEVGWISGSVEVSKNAQVDWLVASKQATCMQG